MKGYNVLLFYDLLLLSFKLAYILHSAAFFLQYLFSLLDPINPYVENDSRIRMQLLIMVRKRAESLIPL